MPYRFIFNPIGEWISGMVLSLHLRKTLSLQFRHEKIVAKDKSNFIFNLVRTQEPKNSKFNSEMTSFAAIFGLSDVL